MPLRMEYVSLTHKSFVPKGLSALSYPPYTLNNFNVIQRAFEKDVPVTKFLKI